MKKIFKILLFIIICQLAGILGSIFTFPSIPTWYAGLIKPTFSPPNYVFGPVWTTLYTLMGISFYWINEAKTSKNKKVINNASMWFVFHLLLNSLWSILFFGLKNPGLAFIEIVILWIVLITVMIKFYKIYKPASLILIPYLLWISFASVLNFSIWNLN